MTQNYPFKLPARYEPARARLIGGQGYVYVCRDSFLDRDVAVKVVKDPADLETLRKEIGLLAGIRSPHVVELYDVVESPKGSVALIQEFVPGGDLEVLDPAVDPVRTIWQLARGLGDIHAQGIIHRDIKPANVKFDAEGVLKVLDFGLAMEAADASTLLGRGTLHYMAPELFVAKPSALTPAVDVYAFGVLVWHLATKGALPPALTRSVTERVSEAHSCARVMPMPSIATVLDLPEYLIEALDASTACAVGARPTMRNIADSLERHLLFGTHRMDISTSYISIPGKTGTLKAGSDSITIRYDGNGFVVAALAGDVLVNNSPVRVGSVLPASSVVTLGASSLGPLRTFVPVDSSHPGVIL